jgi:small nuclear ribonucleoprotein (snRNP)-like protein
MRKERVLMSENKPFDIVHGSLNKKVEIKLKDGRFVRGTLIGYDTDLNFSLDDAEIVGDEMKKKLGTVVIRKNNVVNFSPQDTL